MIPVKAKSRKSKVELLPPDILENVHQMMRDGRLQQIDIVAAVNQLIEEKGLPEEEKISVPGFNRYSQRMAKVGARISQAREVAEVWTAKLGDAPVSDIGKMLQESIRTLAFETSLDMAEGKISADPKALNQLALLSVRIEQAASATLKNETEIRKAFALEAANAIEKIATQQGFTKEGVAELKKEILGIA